LCAMARVDPGLRVSVLRRNCGKGAAVLHGIELAQAAGEQQRWSRRALRPEQKRIRKSRAAHLCWDSGALVRHLASELLTGTRTPRRY
jgi:hypothetical protein